jgi:predicted dehydrogenase
MTEPSPSRPRIPCAVVGLKQGLETVYVLLNHPEFELKLVCDTDPEPFGWLSGSLDPAASAQDYPRIPTAQRMLAALRQCGGRDGIAYTPDYREVLRRADIEAVFLFVPDALHEEFTLAALAAGKRVLCTKPMALSIESAERIGKAARARPNHYMLGFQFTFTPFARQVMAEIRSGSVGRVRLMSFHFHRGPFRPIYRRKAVSGGTVIQECCHWLDLFHLFCGQSRYSKIAGFGGLDAHGAIQDIEDNGELIIEYENGVRAALLFTYFRRSRHPEFFTLVGDKGQMRGTFDQLMIENDAGTRVVEIPGNRRLPGLIHEGYYEMHDEFAAMIREDREPYSGWEAGLENVRVSFAAQRALDLGGLVRRADA